MRTEIFAGTWQIETNAGTNHGADDIVGIYPFRQKLDVMKRVIGQFYSGARSTRWQSANNLHPTLPLFVFVAPEYYFKNALGERCLTKAERDTFIDEMSLLAQSKQNLLILPGTIFWKKDISVDTKGRKKAQQRLYDMQYKLGGEAKVLMEKRSQLQRVGDTQFVAYNTAYLFYGNQKWKYHKMNDAGELANGDIGTVFIPGSSRGIYQIANLDVGIEICADHDSGMLDREVDLHLVTSALVSRKAEHVWAKNGGWFVHASNKGAEAMIVDRTGQVPQFQSATQDKQIRPKLPGNMNEQNEIERRLQLLKNRGLKTEIVERSREKVTREVELVNGGKLTTWSGILDT